MPVQFQILELQTCAPFLTRPLCRPSSRDAAPHQNTFDVHFAKRWAQLAAIKVLLDLAKLDRAHDLGPVAADDAGGYRSGARRNTASPSLQLDAPKVLPIATKRELPTAPIRGAAGREATGRAAVALGKKKPRRRRGFWNANPQGVGGKRGGAWVRTRVDCRHGNKVRANAFTNCDRPFASRDRDIQRSRT